MNKSLTGSEPRLEADLDTQTLAPFYSLARSMEGVGPSTLLKLLTRAARPEVISFAVGLPAAELFPREAFAAACSRTLTRDAAALQYGVPTVRLKSHVVELMARRGVECSEKEILLTTGAQQGMDLLGRLLLDPGGYVLMEDKVFDGMRIALRSLEPKILAIATEAERGIDVDAVEEILAEGIRPAFLYLVPEGQNPLGTSLGAEKRLRLLALSERYRVPIVEDDAYGFLSYDPDPPPAMRSQSDQVLYLGSYSKIFAPSLRVGWIVAPKSLMPHLSALKHAADVDTASFSQRALADCLDHMDFDQHLETLRATYGKRRDTLADAMEKRFPGFQTSRGPIRWHCPVSGFYLWLELLWPEADAMELLELALDHEDVAFTPGEVFSAQAGGSRHCLRLSFAGLDCPTLREGVDRLGRAIENL